MVDDTDEDIENRIITNFMPAEAEGPGSGPPPAPLVPHRAAIDALETLLLYSLRSSDRNTSEWEGRLQQERRRIEGLSISRGGKENPSEDH